MKRQLFAFRFYIQLPRRSDPWMAVVKAGQESLIRMPNGGRFCDLEAGSIVDAGSTGLFKVVRVQIADATPSDQIGRVVTSGRAWVGGGARATYAPVIQFRINGGKLVRTNVSPCIAITSKQD